MSYRFVRSLAIITLALAPVRSFSNTTPLVVIDAHNDTVQNLMSESADFGRRSSQGGIDLPRLREGGVTVPFFAANVPVYYSESDAVRRTLDFRDAMPIQSSETRQLMTSLLVSSTPSRWRELTTWG
jgi:microsomal dipeptidase-like Zn-dependent dipeptidase